MGKAKDRPRATRYMGDDVDEHAAEAALMSMGPPAMVAVFAIPDEEVEEVIQNNAAEEREQFKGRMRALNLNVEQLMNAKGTFLFMKVSAPEPMLKYEAEHNEFRLRLKEKLGGALCKFTQELEDKNAYDKPQDGFALFSSAHQLKIAATVATSEPYDNGEIDDNSWGKEFDPEKCIKENAPMGSQLKAFFPLHHQRNRMKLQFEWAGVSDKPQPLSLVQEYFGEKYALFYTWWGYYITMLWLPALVGLALFISEIFTYLETGALENPYKVVYCVFMVIWMTCFNALWKNLEGTLSYEWDTLDFENEENFRQEFKQNELTEEAHINDVTGEKDDYYYDDGDFFPIPTARARSQVITYIVVMLMNGLTVVTNVYIWKLVGIPLMQPGNVLVGTIVVSTLSSIVSIVVDSIMDGIPELEIEGVMDMLVADANWDTDTTHEDALIMNTFFYKAFTKYFMLVWIAFLANHVEVDGENAWCPQWQCYPVLQVAYLVIVVQGIAWNLLQVKGFPILYEALQPKSAVDDAAAAAGMTVAKTPMELQYVCPEAAAVVDGYMVLVYQLGYVALFALVLPIVPIVCLLYNLSELRSKAMALLTQLKRPEFQCAADIGSYQQVIEIISTMTVITNAFVVGFTSHALYFYFPEMDGVQRVWATVILEHFLFLCKLFVENIIPKEPISAIATYEQGEDRKRQTLEYWGIEHAADY